MNPFGHRTPPPPSELIDRETELEFLLRQFAQGGRVRLSSPRGYGKTTLVEAALARARDDGMLTERIDLYGITSRGELCIRIEDALERSVAGGPWQAARAKLARRGGGLQLAGLAGGQLGPEEQERRLLDALDEPGRLAAERGQRVVVCFDEFQDVLRAGGAEQDRRGRRRHGGLDATIRTVTQRHGRDVAYVFAGSQPSLVGELFTDPERPFYRQADPLSLQPLPRPELGHYVESRFRATDRDVGAALGPLLDLARGHPQRAMLLAHLLWETIGQSDADGDAWGRALAQLDRYVPEEEMRAKWEALTAIQQKVAGVIARREGSPLASQVLKRYGERKDAMQKALQALERDAVLIRQHGRPLRADLIDPLFELWIRNGRHW